MNVLQITDSKQFYLTSTSKLGTKMNGTSNTKINFEIPRFITKQANILYHSLKLLHCEIPYSFYIINETNNIINLVIDSINHFFTVPVGNYNAFTLLTILNTIDNKITFTLNNSNGKYSISSNFPFSLLSSSTLTKIIGGELNTTYNAIHIHPKYILNFPFAVNLLGTRNIFIKCNLILENLQTKTNDNQTLKSIPVNVPPFGLIMYNNIENIESLVKNSQIDNLNIEIYDDDDNLINMNNQDWSITIELKTTLQVSYIKQSIDEYLNNNNN
jgi:hypothetical protein